MANETIVCIEDEADLREAIAEDLEDAGYKVVQAADGKAGLEAILDHQPDLVLSDIMMPLMNGYEVLRAIRVQELSDKYPKFAEMPFIFMSALSDRENVIEGIRLGADDYLPKPVDFDMLQAKIQARLRQIRKIQSKKAEDLKHLFILD
jgi:DNA-binding response OmpR family regulator